MLTYQTTVDPLTKNQRRSWWLQRWPLIIPVGRRGRNLTAPLFIHYVMTKNVGNWLDDKVKIEGLVQNVITKRVQMGMGARERAGMGQAKGRSRV